MGLFTGLGKALSEFKKDFKRVRNWEKRNQKWIKENDRKLKEFKRVEKRQANKIPFDNFEEYFDYWFIRYENLPRRLRNWLMHRGQMKSRFTCMTIDKMDERLKEIDETRLKVEKRAFLTSFEYLFTFTYDSAKNGQRRFKRRLKRTLRRLERRKGWKYVGVWKRSKNNGRLYLQALVKTKNGEIIGGLEKVRDFQKRGRWIKTTMQSRYFNERFGRTIVEKLDKDKEEEYLHYIEKFVESYNAKKAKRIWGRNIPRRLRKDLLLRVRI